MVLSFLNLAGPIRMNSLGNKKLGKAHGRAFGGSPRRPSLARRAPAGYLPLSLPGPNPNLFYSIQLELIP